MIALSVNLNKIALLRNSRSGNFPDVIKYAEVCVAAGADGITVHPRPDQRHIRPGDLVALHNLLIKYPNIELNIEGNPFAGSQGIYPGFIQLVEQNIPTQCTLVPDTDSQLTSDHGFDLIKDGKLLQPIIAQLKKSGSRVSLFMDPDLAQISHAARIGADRIELYTGPFSEAYAKSPHSTETLKMFDLHCAAAEHAHKLGLGVNAGHDLNLDNLVLYRKLPYLEEVSIGHALTADALDRGFEKTVQAYIDVLNSERL